MNKDTNTEKQMVFFPNFLFKEAVAALIVVIALVALALIFPMAMGDPADPSASAFKPKPEWYFMSAFCLLKLCPSSIELVPTVIVPSLGMVFLIFMPFIDKHPERSPKKRPVAMILTICIVIATIALTVAGIYME